MLSVGITKWIKMLVVFFVTLTLIIIISLALLRYLLKDWNVDTSMGDYQIRTSLGDEFQIHYETRNFPDLESEVSVLDPISNKEIIYFVLNSEFVNSEAKTIINTSSLRCYEIYNKYLLCKSGNGEFIGTDIDDIPKMIPIELPDFKEIAEELVATSQWKWIRLCSEYLLRVDRGTKEKITKTLERFAADQFSKRDLEINENSGITKVDMRLFSQQLLNQYS
ncbi:MAG: hypothetical protein P0Y55_06865 [Candidatus Cohnella colombiensis]|uniref:DUF4230 domain-containing protein n=1 Tax=Candidatus Cohnella colombiensis TaxID=3121368 RepID=A0AA95F6A7_9BACL|nr:MAG: hypothetical protein P0Y55_06865 [Cohnella sp.]